MMLQAPLLGRIEGIRHGFFNRDGGVSEGIYASLNGGVGSKDDTQSVSENRARMARALDVAPDRFIGCYQIPMYLTPILLGRFYRRIADHEAGENPVT